MDESNCQTVYVQSNGMSELLMVKTTKDGDKFFRMKQMPPPALKTKGEAETDTCQMLYNSGGKLLSLFQCCLNFVAAHLDRVESFVGFPDEIAKQVWQRQVDSQRSFARDSQLHVLRIFSKAYPESFLHKVRLSNLHVLDCFEEEFESLFAVVTTLDLSDCQLGDNHPFLAKFHRFSWLRHLYLSGNGLTGKGVRSLVNPTMLKPETAFQKLEYLDLSQNDLSAESVSRCANLPHLQYLALTANNDSMAKMFDSVLSAKFERQPGGGDKRTTVETTGWAKPLLESWHRQVIEKLAEEAAASRSKGFYGKKNKLIKQSPVALALGGQLCLYEQCQTVSQPPVNKKLRLESLADQNEIDEDLLQMYTSIMQ